MLVALLMVPLLAISGLVIDVGYAYFTQRSLQTQADAAALAGAQRLPDAAATIGQAKPYGSGKPVNAVVVDETAHVNTLVTKVIGIRSFTVHASTPMQTGSGSRCFRRRRAQATAYQALQQIASNAQSFYNQPTPGQLNTLFSQVAADIQRGSAGLIDNATP